MGHPGEYKLHTFSNADAKPDSKSKTTQHCNVVYTDAKYGLARCQCDPQ